MSQSLLDQNLMAWRGPRYLRAANRRRDLLLVLRHLAAIAKTNASLTAGLAACAEDVGPSFLRPSGGRRSSHPTPGRTAAAGRSILGLLFVGLVVIIDAVLVAQIEEFWHRDDTIVALCGSMLGGQLIIMLLLSFRRAMQKRMMKSAESSAASPGSFDGMRLLSLGAITGVIVLYNALAAWCAIRYPVGAVICVAFEFFFLVLWVYRNSGARRSRLPRGVSRLVLPPTRIALFLALRAHFNAGHTLAEAMAAMDNFFPPEFTGRMRAAERSGSIAPCLDELAERAVSDVRDGESTTARWLYMLLLVPFQTMTMLFLVVKVLPIFSEILRDFATDQPPALRRIVALGDFLMYNWPPLIVGACALVTVSVLAFRHLRGLRRGLDLLLLRLPAIGPRLRYRQAAITARVTGRLLGAGLPLHEALAITQEAGVGPALAARLTSCEAGARNGDSLGECAVSIPAAELPRSFQVLATLGEQGNCVDETMDYAAAQYEMLEKRAQHVLRTVTFPLALALPALLTYILATAVFESLAAMTDAIFYAL